MFVNERNYGHLGASRFVKENMDIWEIRKVPGAEFPPPEAKEVVAMAGSILGELSDDPEVKLMLNAAGTFAQVGIAVAASGGAAIPALAGVSATAAATLFGGLFAAIAVIGVKYATNKATRDEKIRIVTERFNRRLEREVGGYGKSRLNAKFSLNEVLKIHNDMVIENLRERYEKARFEWVRIGRERQSFKIAVNVPKEVEDYHNWVEWEMSNLKQWIENHEIYGEVIENGLKIIKENRTPSERVKPVEEDESSVSEEYLRYSEFNVDNPVYLDSQKRVSTFDNIHRQSMNSHYMDLQQGYFSKPVGNTAEVSEQPKARVDNPDVGSSVPQDVAKSQKALGNAGQGKLTPEKPDAGRGIKEREVFVAPSLKDTHKLDAPMPDFGEWGKKDPQFKVPTAATVGNGAFVPESKGEVKPLGAGVPVKRYDDPVTGIPDLRFFDAAKFEASKGATEVQPAGGFSEVKKSAADLGEFKGDVPVKPVSEGENKARQVSGAPVLSPEEEALRKKQRENAQIRWLADRAIRIIDGKDRKNPYWNFDWYGYYQKQGMTKEHFGYLEGNGK